MEKVSVTRFLSYAKAKDVIVTVKKFLSQRGDVVADDRTNAVIINDIPKAIPTIDRLLTQLDRKTQEVEIEARVVAATRSSPATSVRSLDSAGATATARSAATQAPVLLRRG